MGNMKKFIGNKNVVTLLGMILIVIVLYVFYIWRVRSSTDMISIPIAKEDIEPMEQITENKITMVDVPIAALRGNVVTSKTRLLEETRDGQKPLDHAGVNSFIPTGSFFYYSSEESAGNVVPNDDLPTAFLEYFEPDKDMVAYNYRVNMDSTYSNSMVPGKYVDIYLRFQDQTTGEGYKTGKLISNVKILAVKDSDGRNVFSGTNEVRNPSYMIFGLPYHYNALLHTAQFLNAFVDIIAVPTTVDQNEYVPDVNIDSSTLVSMLEEYLDEQELEVPVDNPTPPVEES
jgi:hypothetical protein